MRNPKARVPIASDFKTCSGELFKPVLSGKLMPDGTIKLAEVDQIDIKAEINSHAATCDMAYILSRLKFGDVSVLNGKEGVYGDFTVFPKTYAEMLQLVQSGEEAFDSLPLDVRASFGNDINKWFASIGTAEWSEKMQIPKPVPTIDVTPAVDVKPVVDVKPAVDVKPVVDA